MPLTFKAREPHFRQVKGTISLIVSLALVLGTATSAQALAPALFESEAIGANELHAPSERETQPSNETREPAAKIGRGKDPNAKPEQPVEEAGQQVQASAASGTPYLEIGLESREYYGQDYVTCWDSGYISLAQGRQYVICAVVNPKDASGNPTNFSANNSFRFIIKDGCGVTVSDVTRYNIGTYGTDPLVLSGEGIGTPILSGLFSTGWNGGCAEGWKVDLIFSGSTLDGSPVSSSASATTTTIAPPPPPPLAPEQTIGDPGPWHAGQGDPVDSLTGAFNYRPDRADLAYAALGRGLDFSRSYASNSTHFGRFGLGWSDSFDARLAFDPTSGNVAYHDPAGPTHIFTRADNSYASPLGVRTQLSALESGWALTFKDQMVYTFDASGFLLSIRDRNGQGPTLNWVNERLASVVASGRSITLTYNAAGLVENLVGSDGRSVTYEYYPEGQLREFTDAAGHTTTYQYDGLGRLASVQDPNGNFPVRNTFDDASGRVTHQLDADGQITRFDWVQAGPDARTGTATVTDPRGNVITDTYQVGYLVSQADADGNVSRFIWDDMAQLSNFIDQLGYTTSFVYDSSGNLSSRTGPDNSVERYNHNSRNDLVETTDFNGNTSTFTYTAEGNLESLSRASISASTGPVVALRNTYNLDGTLDTSSDALGRTTHYQYNDQGDLTSTITPEGRVTTYSHDSSGRVVATVEPRGNESASDPNKYRTTMTWDSLDRVTRTVDPLGHATEIAFDPAGRTRHTVDAKGGVMSYAYGPSSKPLAVQGPDPAVSPQRFTYDPNGNVATAISPSGVVTTYSYTVGNNPKTTSSSGTGTWSYGYDQTGRLTKVTSPSGRSVSLTRTSKGQVSSLIYSDGTPSIRYTYDASGNRKTMSDGRGTTSYSYNAANKLTSATTAGAAYNYTYDEAGQLLTRTLPTTSAATQYTYDRDGRLTSVRAGAKALATYGYDKTTGAVISFLQGGITSTLSIDASKRPVSVEASKGTTTLTRSHYTLDELGNPTQVRNFDGSTDSYVYSPQSRLLAACYGAAECSSTTSTATFRYNYDGDGNITSVIQPTGTTAYVYDSAGRVISREGLKGPATYQYDEDGNTTSDGTASYAWNAASQLTKIISGTTSTTYTYDGDNHRISSTTGRSSTTNSYEPTTGALAFEQSGTKTLRQYDYGLGLLSMTAGTSTHSYLTDALGSVRGVATSSGALSLSYAYHPYGDSRSTTAGKNAPQNPIQFTGAYLSAPLYQMGARDYNPKDGRFLSPDPAGIAGRGYAYAGANPMANIDPTGLSEYDWRKLVNGMANGVANASGTVAITCTIALVVCGQIVPVAGVLSLATSAVAVVTSDQTDSCLSGRSSCPQAIVGGAMAMAGGKFGIGGKVSKAAGMDTVRAAGLAGEKAAGVVRNSQHIPSLSGTAAYRIPDGLNSYALEEVKNVSRLSYSRQLQDFAAYSKQNGLAFNLYVRGGSSPTTLSGPLQAAVDKGDINLIRSLP